MFIVVRPKKDDLRPLSLYYGLNIRVKSQNKAYRLVLRVFSQVRNISQEFDPFYSAHHGVFIGQGAVMISP